MSVTTLPSSALAQRQPSWPVRLFDYKPFLIVMCLAPAIGLLAVFLTYPLGLGIWLSFTDTRIGRVGQFIGTENYEWLWDDAIFWLSVTNTLLYTFIASAFKFAIGLYLALLLNENMPFKAMLRALV